MSDRTEQGNLKPWRIHPEACRQIGAILVMSCILGLAYNASNPIGIRWSEPARSSPPAPPPAHQTQRAPEPAKPSNAVAPAVISLAAKTNSPSGVVTNSAASPATSYVPPTPTTWAEVKPLDAQGRVVLVDARPRAFYDAGHIPRAVSLPEPPSAEQLAAFRKQYPTNAHVVVYCSSTSCSLSFKLATRLAKEGAYEFVQFITGGYQAWQREETLAHAGGISSTGRSSLTASGPREMPAQEIPPILPLVEARPTGQKLENALPITWAQTRPLLGINQAVLLDARSKAEYDLGHITGAISIPADSSPEKIRQVLADRKSTARLVAYCGAMGCPEAFRLATRLMRELDYPNSQFMLDGYAEWRRAQKTAVAHDKAGP